MPYSGGRPPWWRDISMVEVVLTPAWGVLLLRLLLALVSLMLSLATRLDEACMLRLAVYSNRRRFDLKS